MLAASMLSLWPSIPNDRQGPSLHHWLAIALDVCGQNRPGTSGVLQKSGDADSSAAADAHSRSEAH